MNMSLWLKEYNGLSLSVIRKNKITNEEWNMICKEYEKFCKKRKIKPEYR
ncbi:hypothetical protein [Bacillus massiliigorillae]|nr:hypothetical protein [Bacillus massiliigorillae]